MAIKKRLLYLYTMIQWLLQHNWKSIKRSPDFERKLVIKIVFGLILLFFGLQLLLLGIFLSRMINEDISPGSNPVVFLNGFLVYYFGIDFIFRLIFQKLRSTAGRPYLLLSVERKKISHFVLLKTLGTAANIIPLIVFVPFLITGVFPRYDFISSMAWIFTIVGLFLFNTFFANYNKMRFYKNPVITSLIIGSLIGIVLMEKMQLVSFTSLSATLFNSVLQYPAFIFVCIILVGLIYRINHRYIIDNLYTDSITIEKGAKQFKENFKLLGGFGEYGTLISLDIKLMLRNKRARISLWMPFLFIFYGFFFYPSENYTRGDLFTDFMLLFAGTFITGFFIMSYGITTFCYESSHFGVILTKRINMLTYLKARYYFMLLMTIPMYLFSLFYIFYGARIFTINSIMFLFNIGIGAFLFLFISVFNKIKFDLGADIFSMQGKGSNHFLAVFILIILLLIIYIPLRLSINKEFALYTIGFMGILGFIFHNQILNLLLRLFNSRKYIMSEGFRQT